MKTGKFYGYTRTEISNTFKVDRKFLYDLKKDNIVLYESFLLGFILKEEINKGFKIPFKELKKDLKKNGYKFLDYEIEDKTVFKFKTKILNHDLVMYGYSFLKEYKFSSDVLNSYIHIRNKKEKILKEFYEGEKEHLKYISDSLF